MLDNRRQESRDRLAAAGTIYDKVGNLVMRCVVLDLSKNGARLELPDGAALPRYFLLSLMPDGSARRLCGKVWQLVHVAGVRFVEK